MFAPTATLPVAITATRRGVGFGIFLCAGRTDGSRLTGCEKTVAAAQVALTYSGTVIDTGDRTGVISDQIRTAEVSGERCSRSVGSYDPPGVRKSASVSGILHEC